MPDTRLDKNRCVPVPPPSKELIRHSTDAEVNVILGQVIVRQNSVISHCIKQMRANEEYLLKVKKGIESQ